VSYEEESSRKEVRCPQAKPAGKEASNPNSGEIHKEEDGEHRVTQGHREIRPIPQSHARRAAEADHPNC
jgi:hypothetical protein